MSEVTDVEFLRAIEAVSAASGYGHANLWPLAEHLDVHENRVKSKARRTYRRGLTLGCICGCRGEFQLTDAGRALLADATVKEGTV